MVSTSPCQLPIEDSSRWPPMTSNQCSTTSFDCDDRIGSNTSVTGVDRLAVPLLLGSQRDHYPLPLGVGQRHVEIAVASLPSRIPRRRIASSRCFDPGPGRWLVQALGACSIRARHFVHRGSSDRRQARHRTATVASRTSPSARLHSLPACDIPKLPMPPAPEATGRPGGPMRRSRAGPMRYAP